MAVAALTPSAAPASAATIQLAQAALRRGEVLPDAYRGQVVTDYERWRLRRPPTGYAWYRVGNQFVLASMSTGVIFDIVDVNG
jgi:Ni/Co efflux regulator RcnB